jgi:riboflavin kinase/FMN adenylyltransferase
MEPVNLGKMEVSSTRIRGLLDQGDVAGAAQLLGRPYEVSGVVGHGSDRGASIGLPTANIRHWPKKKLPGAGVYATETLYKGELHLGVTNVGYRPTFEDQEKPNVETHILDFDRDIYGDMLTLKFIQKIRNEEKFASLNAFLEQIEHDKAAAREIFRNER